MLAATEPQVDQRLEDRVTDGGRSPVRTQMLGLILVVSATGGNITNQRKPEESGRKGKHKGR